ncbi:MAG: ribosome-associated translation inhibitor RaiA [Oscillospiraceae bacterium]|jgi:putative sigma-54 modulation protein|nr:ribosome-associated translation inhibitor RaiA [Oscillospiraceae bacterium]
MKTTVIGRKCAAGPQFQAHAEKKLAKIERLLGGDSELATAKITATAEKNGMVVEVTVTHQGVTVRAEERAQQINDALDDCVDVLIRQLRKNKTRVERKIRNTQFSAMHFEAEPHVEEETSFDIVRIKQVPCKPIDVEEAILQMNLLGHQFFVFQNAENDLVCVVYRRRDGGYGVLVPTAE